MYVLDVIALGRTAVPGPLSYRSAHPRDPGTLIAIPLRKGETLGVVIACDHARDRKAELKSASYTLKGSREVVRGCLPQAFMAAATEVALWHAVPFGTVLALLLAEIRDVASAVEIAEPGEVLSSRVPASNTATVEQGLREREVAYRAHIEALPQGAHALMVVPTRAEVTYWSARLADLGARGRMGARKATARTQARILVTPPERSLATWIESPPSLVILERAGSGSYLLPARPHLDARRVHEQLARAYGAAFVVGDLPLPLEFRPQPTTSLPKLGLPRITVVDARRDPDAPGDTGPWKVFPDAVAHQIGAALAEPGARVLLLGVRSGYAPAVVCRDCGQAVVDERGRAVSFATERGTRIFRTTDGVTVRPADTACSRCGSWNLLPLGVGVERIAEAARESFPDASIALLTTTTIASPKRTREALGAVTQGGLIIGTEAVLPIVLAEYGTQSISFACVVSADSLLAVPFWRARERFVRLALFVAGLAHASAIVTRRPEDAALAVLKNPTDPAFFVEEYGLRVALGYPPATVLISVARTGTPQALARLEPRITEALADTSARTLPDSPISGTLMRRTTILTIPAADAPDRALAARLAALPPSCAVRVDPEALW